jgi:hypothetical protein
LAALQLVAHFLPDLHRRFRSKLGKNPKKGEYEGAHRDQVKYAGKGFPFTDPPANGEHILVFGFPHIPRSEVQTLYRFG